MAEPERKRFEPKQPVKLDPPKDDPITMEELSKCDGMDLYVCRVQFWFPFRFIDFKRTVDFSLSTLSINDPYN